MKSAYTWLYIAVAVATGVVANAVSAAWARGASRYSWQFFTMLLISPFVFISFGLVTARLGGLAIGSGVLDSLLTLGTIVVGLFLYQEWRAVSMVQYLGMALALAGVFLMLFFPKAA
jgi:hypothetical protein